MGFKITWTGNTTGTRNEETHDDPVKALRRYSTLKACENVARDVRVSETPGNDS